MGVPLCTTRDAQLVIMKDRASNVERMVSLFLSLRQRHSPLPVPLGVKFYNSVCLPKLLYGLEYCVVEKQSIELLETVHRQSARRLQGLPSNAPSPVPFATMGWLSINALLHIAQMLMLYRILNLSVHSIYKKVLIARVVYHMDSTGDKPTHTGPIWSAFSTCVRYGMDMLLTQMLETGEIIPINEWKYKVKEKVEATELSKWNVNRYMYKSLDIFNSCTNKIGIWLWWRIGSLEPALSKAIQLWLDFYLVKHFTT